MNTRVLHLLSCTAFASTALLAAGSNQASAQEQSQKVTLSLEEVLVTARRREENLMDTPVSISAFSASDMKAQQIDQVDQVANATPGLVFQRQAGNNNHTSRIFIRGIGQADQVPTKQVGVGLYVDGVYVAQNAGSLIDVVDVEAVEVLRGPQGTLFGRNTIGGAIQINTVKPSEEFYGEAEVLVGNFDRRRLKAMVNIPFSDNFYGRFSGITQRKDGYVDTPFATDRGKGGDDVDALRAAFRFVPNDSFTADLALDFSEQKSFGPPSVLGSPVSNLAIAAATPSGFRNNTAASYNGGTDPSFLAPAGPFPGAPLAPANLGPGVVGTIAGTPVFDDRYYLGPNTYTSLTGEENLNKTEVFGTNLTLEWDVSDSFSIKSITSYRDIDVVAFGDFDNTPLKVFHGFDNHEGDAFSQEIQLSGTAFNDKMAWVGGLYHYSEDLLNTNFVDFPQFAQVSGAKVDNQSQAVFGQLTYDLTDKLALTVGARYTEEEFDYVLDDNIGFVSSVMCAPQLSPIFVESAAACDAAGLNNSPFPPTFPGIPPGVDPRFPNGFTPNGNPNGFADVTPGAILVPFADDRMPLGTTQNEFDPYFNLSYDLTEELMVYTSYSEGFKGGGFTQRILPGQQVQSFAPEFAKVYELGAKWQSENLRVTGAIFHNDYTDLQLLTLETAGGVTRNAGEATIQGGELETTWVVTEGFTLTYGVAYLDSEYDNLGQGLEAGVALPINEDARLPFTSEWQHNAAASYAVQIGGGQLVSRLDWFYTSSYFAEAQNLPEHRYGDYKLWKGGLTYIPDSEKWEAAFGVTNLTDENYRVAGSQTIAANGWNQQIVAPPRQWSLRYQYNF